ncbi:MAG: GGDEF domain-containing protein, partial [Lachnospiraceae bacterium]|nr:GGDEF domain-containing protein [Lachnospiraceae bacterium]
IIVVIGIVFTVLFLAWTRRAITNPIQIIESRVVEFARQSHGQTDPKALIIDMPDIQTRNELQSLSKAIIKLSEDMRDYLINALAARDEAKTANQKAIEMGEQAIRDSLTGIRNRNAYDAEVKKIGFRIGSEAFTKFGIAVVDLNFLKRINDTFGHEKGNEAIRKICMITCKIFAHSPVFRIGGDEFVVILENDDYEHIEERIEDFQKVLQDIRDDSSLEPWEQVSAAIGWSMFDPVIDGNVDNVFKRADHKMYENKKAMKAARE